jgi:hypothetical protein
VLRGSAHAARGEAAQVFQAKPWLMHSGCKHGGLGAGTRWAAATWYRCCGGGQGGRPRAAAMLPLAGWEETRSTVYMWRLPS